MRQRLIGPGSPDFWTPTRQPLRAVQIDRSHWFGARLNPSDSICCLGNGGATIDLVSGRKATVAGTVLGATSNMGRVARADGLTGNPLAWSGMPTAPSSVTLLALFVLAASQPSFFTVLGTSGGNSGVGLTANTGSSNALSFIRKGIAFDGMGWPDFITDVPYLAAASWNGTDVNHVLARLDTNTILASGNAASGSAATGDGSYCVDGAFGLATNGGVYMAAIQPQRYGLAQLLELASNPYAFFKPLQRGPLIGASSTTGTAAQTLQPLTQTALGAGTVSGSAAQTLQHLSQAAASSTAVSGTAAQALQHLTQAALGAETVTGTAVQTLRHLAQAATSAATVTGSAAQTLQRLTQSAIAVTTVSGSAAQTLKRLTMQAIGSSADTTKMFLVMR